MFHCVTALGPLGGLIMQHAPEDLGNPPVCLTALGWAGGLRGKRKTRKQEFGGRAEGCQDFWNQTGRGSGWVQ